MLDAMMPCSARAIKCMEKLDCAGRAERLLAGVEEGTPGRCLSLSQS
eukprot:COSAG06_NODE_3922_length_4763_cov_9.796312_2_plen_47_part_00